MTAKLVRSSKVNAENLDFVYLWKWSTFVYIMDLTTVKHM